MNYCGLQSLKKGTLIFFWCGSNRIYLLILFVGWLDDIFGVISWGNETTSVMGVPNTCSHIIPISLSKRRELICSSVSISTLKTNPIAREHLKICGCNY